MEEHEEIVVEASRRFREWNHQGVRGQVIMPQDGLEYWVWLVSKERYSGGNV